MTHYNGMVLTRNGEHYSTVVEPFDESIELPLHVSMTRDQIIDYEIKRSENALKHNENRVSQMDKDIVSGKINRDEIYSRYREVSREEFDGNGNSLTTYNDDAKWDWYADPEDEPVWDKSGKVKAGELESQLKDSVSKILGSEINDYDAIDADKLTEYLLEDVQPLEENTGRLESSILTGEEKKMLEDDRNHWNVMPDWFVYSVAYTDNGRIPHWDGKYPVYWLGFTGKGMSDGEWIRLLLKVLHENADSTAWMIGFHI